MNHPHLALVGGTAVAPTPSSPASAPVAKHTRPVPSDEPVVYTYSSAPEHNAARQLILEARMRHGQTVREVADEVRASVRPGSPLGAGPRAAMVLQQVGLRIIRPHALAEVVVLHVEDPTKLRRELNLRKQLTVKQLRGLVVLDEYTPRLVNE